jgi:hypothetical protein
MLQRIGANGAPIAAARNVSTATTGTKASIVNARLSWSSTYGGYAIVSSAESTTLHFQRLGADGSAPDAVSAVVMGSSGTVSVPSVAVSPTGEWGVAVGATNNIWLVLFNPDGSRTKPLTTLESSPPAGAPRIVHDGTSWITAWVAAISPTWSVVVNRGAARGTTYTALSESVPANSNPPAFVGMTVAGGVLTMGFTRPAVQYYDFRLRRFLLPASPGAPSPISDAVVVSDMASISNSFDATLAVGSKTIGLWSDHRTFANELYARSVDTLGCP